MRTVPTIFLAIALVGVSTCVLAEPPLGCGTERHFHLERLKANKALKIVVLNPSYVQHIQRYINMTEQTPLDLSRLARLKVYVAWQNHTAILSDSAPPIGVIDAVQDGCVVYRLEADAYEITAIANGTWRR